MKKLHMILACTLSVMMLFGCANGTAELPGDTDTVSVTYADETGAIDTADEPDGLRSETVKNEDGTYTLKITGYDEEKHDEIFVSGLTDYSKYGFPNTLSDLKNVVQNNDWSEKSLAFLANAMDGTNIIELKLADVTMVDRIMVFEHEIKITSTFVAVDCGGFLVNFEYRDPALIYYTEDELAADPFGKRNSCMVLMLSKEHFEKSIIKYTKHINENANSTGYKEGIPTQIYTRYISDEMKSETWYWLEWGNYKVLAKDQYSSISSLYSLAVLVSDETNNVYYTITIPPNFKTAPTIDWIKNFVEGKPTTAAVTE